MQVLIADDPLDAKSVAPLAQGWLHAAHGSMPINGNGAFAFAALDQERVTLNRRNDNKSLHPFHFDGQCVVVTQILELEIGRAHV